MVGCKNSMSCLGPLTQRGYKKGQKIAASRFNFKVRTHAPRDGGEFCPIVPQSSGPMKPTEIQDPLYYRLLQGF